MRYSYYNDEIEEWTNIVAISANIDHVVGLKADGTVVAIGDDDDGKLNVSGWRNIVAIATGYNHTVGLRADGTVVATGRNDDGECNVSNWKDIKVSSSSNMQFEAESNTDKIDSDSGIDEVTKNNISLASGILGRKFDSDGSITVSEEEGIFLDNGASLFGIKGYFELGASSSGEENSMIDLIDWTSDAAVDNLNVVIDALKELYGSVYVVKPYFDYSDDTYMWMEVDKYEYVLCWQNVDDTVTIRWIYPISISNTYNEPITNRTPGMFLDYELGGSVFPDYVSEQVITIDEVNGHLYSDSTDNATIDSLYWVSANSNGNRQEIVDTAHERIISYFENRYGNGEEVKVPSGVFQHYWGFDDETVTQFITETGLVYLVGPNSEHNIYVVQIKEPYK